MNIEYNEAADTAARAVVDGDVPSDITFDEADPPIGSLRTIPQISHTTPDKPDTIQKITNIEIGIKKQSKRQHPPSPKMSSAHY